MVTTGARPPLRAVSRKLVSSFGSCWMCSVSTSTKSYPVCATMRATEGRRHSNTLKPTTGSPARSFSLAGFVKIIAKSSACPTSAERRRAPVPDEVRDNRLERGHRLVDAALGVRGARHAAVVRHERHAPRPEAGPERDRLGRRCGSGEFMDTACAVDAADSIRTRAAIAASRMRRSPASRHADRRGQRQAPGRVPRRAGFAVGHGHPRHKAAKRTGGPPGRARRRSS